MKKHTKSRQLIGCLCVFLALVCAFCLLLPHLHEHDGLQCPVCALLSIMEGLPTPAVVLALFAPILTILILLWIVPYSWKVCSLVQLKVKLSN